MGWNSWNYYGCNVSDAIIRTAANAMITNCMAAAGYQCVNLDDCWQVSRDTNVGGLTLSATPINDNDSYPRALVNGLQVIPK